MSGHQLYLYVEQRLNRWRAWYHTGRRPGPERVVSWWGPGILDRNVAHDGLKRQIKVDPTEAAETDRAVRALPIQLRKAVFEVYTKGGTMDQKARTLRCHLRTLYRRIERAWAELIGLFNDLAAGLPLSPNRPRIKNSLTVRHEKPNILAIVA